MKDKIRERETKAVKEYFGLEIKPKDLKLSSESVNRLKDLGLGIHFLPEVNYKDFPKKSLSDFFLKLSRNKKLKEESLRLKSGWVLIEEKARIPSKKLWVWNNKLFELLDALGFDLRNLLGLSPELDFTGWNNFQERIGITRAEIEEDVLPDLNRSTSFGEVRLPRYLEYVYLGKHFYNNWGSVRRWDWLKDKTREGKFLAAGYEKVSTLGIDPPNRWSTILGYRLLVK